MAVTEDLLVRLTVDTSGVVKGTVKARDAFGRFAKSADKATESTGKLRDEFGRFVKGAGAGSKKAAAGLTGLGRGFEQAAVAVTAANQAMQLLGVTMNTVGRTVGTFVNGFADFETALVGVQKTTDISGERLKAFGRGMQELSETIPVASTELLGIAQTAGQLGVETKNIEKFTETIAKIGFATDLTSEQAATAFTRILTVTGEGTDNIDKFASTVVALGNNFAATESEIVRVSTEVANATAAFSVNSEAVAGISAALKQMGTQAQLGGSVIGKTMRELDTVIRSGTGPAFEELIRLTGIAGPELRKTFKDDATVVFESFVKGLQGVAEADGSVSATLEVFKLKGDEVNKVLPSLASNADVLTSALGLARQEAGKTADELERTGALNVEAGRAFDTLRASLGVAGNALDNLVASIGESLAPAIILIVEGFTEVVKFAKQMADGLQNMGIPGTVITVTALTAAIGTMLAVAIIPLIPALIAAKAALAGFIAAAAPAVAAFALVAAKVIAITAAIAALAAGTEIVIRNWDELSAFVSSVVNELGKLFSDLDTMFREAFGGQESFVVQVYDGILAAANFLFEAYTGVFGALVDVVLFPFIAIEKGATSAFDNIMSITELFVSGWVGAFDLANTFIKDTFGVSLVKVFEDTFNAILNDVIQPVIDQINKVIDAAAGFFGDSVARIEVSLSRIGAEAELTGKRLDTGITGDVFEKVGNQIDLFRGKQEQATAQAAAAKPTYDTLAASLNGMSINAAMSEQRFQTLEKNLGSTATAMKVVTKAEKELGEQAGLTAAQVKAIEDAEKSASKEARKAAKERLKLVEDLQKGNLQLATDIKSFGATEEEMIQIGLASRMLELDLLEAKIGKTKELADARRLASEMAALETAAQPTNLGDVGAGVSAFTEGLFSPDVVSNAMGVMSDLGDAAMEIPGDLAAGLADIDVADIFSGIGAGLSLMSPDSINQAADMVSQIGDFPSAMLKAFKNLDQALKKFLESFPEALKGLLSALPSILASIVDAIPQVITMLANALPDLFVVLAEAVGPLLTAIISKLPLIVKKFMQAMVRALPILIKGLADGIISLIKLLPEIFDAIVSELPALIEALAEAMPEIAIGLIDAIIGLFLNGGIFRIMAGLAKAALNIIPSILKGLFRGFGKMFKIGKILDPIKKVFSPKIIKNMVKPIEMSFIPLKILFEKVVKPVFERFVKINKVIFEKIVKPIFARFIKINKMIFEKIVKPIFKAYIDSHKALFEQVIKPIFEAFVSVLRVLFEDVIQPIFQAFVDVFQGIIDAFDPIIQAFQSIGDTLASVGDMFSNLDFASMFDFGAISDGFSNMFSGLGSIFDFSAISDGFRKMFELLNPANLLNKLFDFTGLQDKFNDLFAKISPQNLLKDMFNLDVGASGRGTVENLLNVDVPFVSFAQGGLVPGKASVFGDSARNDTVPALLSPGELVIPRSIVRDSQIMQVIQSIIDGKAPGFALGGTLGKIASGDVSGAAGDIGGGISSTAQKAATFTQNFATDPGGTLESLITEGGQILKDGLQQIIETVIPGLFDPIKFLMKHVKEALELMIGGTRGRLGFNLGGLVPGSGGPDSVPSMLTPGEFVVNRPAVQAVGEPFMRALNNTGTVPVNQEINVTLNIDAGKQTLDEAFIKNRVMPAAVEAVKRASLDRKFTMSARGLRSS